MAVEVEDVRPLGVIDEHRRPADRSEGADGAVDARNENATGALVCRL
jgi:hypothetical protein